MTELRRGMVGLLASMCEGVVVLEAGLAEGKDDNIFDCGVGGAVVHPDG